jgi:hypothetical protein
MTLVIHYDKTSRTGCARCQPCNVNSSSISLVSIRRHLFKEDLELDLTIGQRALNRPNAFDGDFGEKDADGFQVLQRMKAC